METVKDQKQGEFSNGKLLQTHFPIVKNRIINRITYSEFQFSFAPKKKDGTIGKPKIQIVNISHTYCPFCGEKHES